MATTWFYPEGVRLGAAVAIVGDQRRSAVLGHPSRQLLDDDATLGANLHVVPTFVRLHVRKHTHTNVLTTQNKTNVALELNFAFSFDISVISQTCVNH